MSYNNPLKKFGLFGKKREESPSPSPRLVKASTSVSPSPRSTRSASQPPEPKAAHKHAVALYDFESSVAGELSFHTDDKLLILQQNNNDWWTALSTDGSKGFVPANYLKLVSDEEDTTDSAKLAVALFAFHGNTPNELSFNIDDKLIILQQSGEWWLARHQNGEKKGWVPASYLQLDEETAPVSVHSAPQEAPRRRSFVIAKSVEPAAPPKCEVSKLFKAKAVMEFCGDSDAGELSFNAGDEMEVISTTVAGAEGWWRVELNGKEGIAPQTFLQVSLFQALSCYTC